MHLDLEIDRIKKTIKKEGAKKVCIQLPDGLKAQANQIYEALDSCGAEVYIWLNSNFGACDVPKELDGNGFDIIFNFGHSKN